MFDEKDLQQIREHGLTPEQAETQLENFRRGFPFLNVVRAASPGDGVLVVGAAEADAAVEALIRARADAKKAKNFAEADRIRDELTAQGIELADIPNGAKWKRV